MITLTISRDELALADLVITSDPYSGDFHIPEEGTTWPRITMRREYAPPSAFIPGEMLLSSVRGTGQWQATVYAHGSNAALLAGAMDELEDALTQFEFEVTLDINGVARTYPANPDFPDWGEVDTGMARAFMARATFTLQLNPRIS